MQIKLLCLPEVLISLLMEITRLSKIPDGPAERMPAFTPAAKYFQSDSSQEILLGRRNGGMVTS
jgi:hypothetical protein